MDMPLQRRFLCSFDWRINYLIWKMALARSVICLDNQRTRDTSNDMPSGDHLFKPQKISERRQLLRAVVGSLRCKKDEESSQIRKWSVEAAKITELRGMMMGLILNLEEDVQRLCVICHDREKCVILMPCRHLCLCVECSNHDAVNSCPKCRAVISSKINVYL